MFSSKTDLWATPQDFFDSLNAEFNFDVDVCASPENAKCKTYFTKDQDGLSQPWTGVCWCNPPYGREIGKWVEKAYTSSRNRGGGRRSLCCCPHELIPNGFTNTYIINLKSDLSKED